MQVHCSQSRLRDEARVHVVLERRVGRDDPLPAQHLALEALVLPEDVGTAIKLLVQDPTLELALGICDGVARVQKEVPDGSNGLRQTTAR